MIKCRRQSSAFVACTFVCHLQAICGNSEKNYPGPSLRNCRSRICSRTLLLPPPDKPGRLLKNLIPQPSPAWPALSSAPSRTLTTEERTWPTLGMVPSEQWTAPSNSVPWWEWQEETYIATSLVQGPCCSLKKQRVLFFQSSQPFHLSWPKISSSNHFLEGILSRTTHKKPKWPTKAQ